VADWDLDRLYKHVKKLQPYCAVGVNHTIAIEPGSRKFALPDSMVVDNKYTFHYFPGDFRLWDPKIAHKADKKQYLNNGESYYMPFEHTICLSNRWNWFQKKELIPVRDLDELEELFYWCTDNNNTLVVNIPPDQTGRIREHEANAIIALGRRLGIQKNKPLPCNGKFISINTPANATSVLNNNNSKFGAQLAVDGGMQTRWAAADTLAELEISLDEKQLFNKIAIFEYPDIKQSKDQFSTYRTNRIQSYCIDILKDNAWQTIYMSEQPMGDCKVIRFPTSYKSSKLKFRVLKATAPPSITELNVIYMDKNSK
jgi:alpha-L-fucosidase